MTSVAPATPSAPTPRSSAPYPSKRNRRRYTRIPTRQMRSCYLAQGVGPADGWIVDISLGGVFLRSSWPLPIGERLAIELPRGIQPPVCVRGRVVSSNRSGARAGMGVKFDTLDPVTHTQVSELVRGLAPAGTKLELKVEDIEVTAVALAPLDAPAPNASAPFAPSPANTPLPRLSAPMAPSSANTPLPRVTAPTPSPIPHAQPSAPRPLVRDLTGVLEIERLRNHAKGLLMQVGDLQTQLAVKDREIECLREAVAHLQSSNAQLLRERAE